jgi:rod shape-determining protein MreD
VRGLISVVVIAVTVVFQLTVADRIAFPGGSGPDLVLLVVAALALATGPMAGALTGFWAGLALDVAPPGSHFVGQDALVFCLIGYACGLLADDSSGDGATEAGHTAFFEIVVTAVGTVCGEALAALLGVMLSDPRVTWPAITRVLPVAVAYDVLLCPFVLYAAAAALRLAGTRGEAPRAGWSPARAGAAVPAAGLGAVRRLGAGNTPRLRLSDRGKGGRAQGSIGGMRSPRARPEGSALRTAGFLSPSMGRSWLGGSVFSRSSSSLGLSSPLGRSSTLGRSVPLGRSSPFRHRGMMRSPGRGWLRRRPARGGSLGTGSLGTGSIGRGAFGRGAFWRGTFGRGTFGRGAFGRGAFWRGAFGRGTMGRGTFGRRGFGSRTGWPGAGQARLRMARPRAKRRWRTGGYR